MNLVVFLFGSGLAFFAGVGLVLVAVGLARRSRLASRVLALVGLALVALSATPLPPWFYAAAGAVSLGWLVAARDRWLRLAAALAWLAGGAAESAWQVSPTVPRGPDRTLTVIGDSVSAGTGEPGMTPWPELLAAKHNIPVENRSRVGATCRSALPRVVADPPRDGVVLLEIGGNDVLGGTAADDFERDLDALLAAASGPGRVVVMLELPLPPLANGFGRAQRRLAMKHGAALVPKRVFAGVITADGATSDGIHLTAAGHAAMADAVAAALRTGWE